MTGAEGNDMIDRDTWQQLTKLIERYGDHCFRQGKAASPEDALGHMKAAARTLREIGELLPLDGARNAKSARPTP